MVLVLPSFFTQNFKGLQNIDAQVTQNEKKLSDKIGQRAHPLPGQTLYFQGQLVKWRIRGKVNQKLDCSTATLPPELQPTVGATVTDFQAHIVPKMISSYVCGLH